MKRIAPSKTLAALALSALPLLSHAHSGHGVALASGFNAGWLHPFTGMDHMAAMVAVGAWSAAQTQRAWRAPLLFTGVLTLAAAVTQATGLAWSVEPMVMASLLILGLMLASATKVSERLALGLIGGFALAHGAAHGQELIGSASLLGMALGSLCLHASGMGLGVALRRQSLWWRRAAGAVVSFSGLSLAWNLLAA